MLASGDREGLEGGREGCLSGRRDAGGVGLLATVSAFGTAPTEGISNTTYSASFYIFKTKQGPFYFKSTHTNINIKDKRFYFPPFVILVFFFSFTISVVSSPCVHTRM